MKLDDLFDTHDLDTAIDAGHVRTQEHPRHDLTIFNYTDAATYDRAWTDVTRTCRGLIVDDATGEVIARPFPKFFNHGEPGAPALDLDEPCIVTDKADGSLGILYPLNSKNWLTHRDEYAVATRGSFASEQALHATATWKARYEPFVDVPAGWTLLFEIIYPANRIVVDYGGVDDLILLGAVHIETGEMRAAADVFAWTGPRISEFPHATLRDALAADPRPGQEGLVVRYLDGRMVKIKQADYIAMHRIVTGCTARTLWEFLAVHACLPHVEQGKREQTPVEFLVRKLQMGPDRIEQILAAGPGWQDQYLLGVPEEFRDWAAARIVRLRIAAHTTRGTLQHLYGRARAATTTDDRAGFVRAARAVAPQCWQQLMSIHDNRQTETWVWTNVRPDHERPYRAITEENA